MLRQGNICSPSELSEYLGISRSKFSKEVKELKDLNYITQIIDERDGRSLHAYEHTE
ncbi:MarR family transcriptional regulator [Paenibacillus guangzhouensis]|uniref:MarR family transcriptional regulator n=1 Tax=Paenibacillus guangzhouensis TaxID=1473112 RepID=UPI00187B94B1